MPPWRRNKGENNPEPVLSKNERPEENVLPEEPFDGDATPSVDVVITPPVIVIDPKNPKKDK
jgi:P pilus assembly chaperone PapD